MRWQECCVRVRSTQWPPVRVMIIRVKLAARVSVWQRQESSCVDVLLTVTETDVNIVSIPWVISLFCCLSFSIPSPLSIDYIVGVLIVNRLVHMWRCAVVSHRPDLWMIFTIILELATNLTSSLFFLSFFLCSFLPYSFLYFFSCLSDCLIKRNFKYLKTESFTLLYKNMVRSQLDYCSSVWSRIENAILKLLKMCKRKPQTFCSNSKIWNMRTVSDTQTSNSVPQTYPKGYDRNMYDSNRDIRHSCKPKYACGGFIVCNKGSWLQITEN